MNDRKYNLLVETSPHLAKIENSNQFPIIMSGVFMEAGKVNANNRQYDINDLVQAVDNFQKIIKQNRALSELEHSDSTEINPDRACARILELKRDDSQFLGKAVVLGSNPEMGIIGTPSGTLLQSLLQYGTSVGWSSRGVGDLGHDNIVRDYHLVTVDCVLDPSTGHMSKSNSKFVDGILESADFVIKNHPSTEIIFEAVNKKMINLPKKGEFKHDKINKIINQFFVDIKNI